MMITIDRKFYRFLQGMILALLCVFRVSAQTRDITINNDHENTYLFNLTAGYDPFLITDTFDGANSVVSADIDDDGDNDVLGAARFGDDIVWWENLDGSGFSWTNHVIFSFFNGAQSVVAVDLNQNGNMAM